MIYIITHKWGSTGVDVYYVECDRLPTEQDCIDALYLDFDIGEILEIDRIDIVKISK